MLSNAHWIRDPQDARDRCPLFQKVFTVSRPVKKATLFATARGVYEATLNGVRIGEQVLTPGWTVFEKRVLFQEYDVTALIGAENTLQIQQAGGWYRGMIASNDVAWRELPPEAANRSCAIIAALALHYTDGECECVVTDDTWLAADGPLQFCDIYDGLIYDATVTPQFDRHAVISENDDLSVLEVSAGEPILPHERLAPCAVIHTPKGETVLDFGQNITGTVALSLTATAGERVSLSFAETLDGDGNVYTENYRTAKCRYEYTCRDGAQTFFPTLTFYGFRYVRINASPTTDPAAFTAVVIHSRLERTGHINTSEPLLNQLYSNIIWGQRDNYLDVPTDCPQRDERLGWTGDAQVFVRAASYNFNVLRFFRKWLLDMRDSQKEHGGIPVVVPNMAGEYYAAAWSDAVTIIPWQLYQTYGDTDVLRMMFPSMTRWVDYITNVTPSFPLWTDHFQYGDWVGLDAPYGSYRGASREELVATAFYAHSTDLVCRIGKLLGEDVARYETLYSQIVSGFKAAYDGDFRTQTEHVLALQFGLTDHADETARSLAALIHKDGTQLRTGFVGTPYLLHVLSDHGYADLAYELLLRREYPSWLYSVTQGATTIWEHWDNVRPDGTMWSADMNSFNHYAYGAVADWMYGVCAGINPATPGYDTVLFRPVATDRLDHFSATFQTAHGEIRSSWRHENGRVVYEITTPRPATAIIEGKTYTLDVGTHRF